MSLTNVLKYRPHRPHRLQCGCLRDFLAGGIVTGQRPQAIGYRPPRQLPPADRPPGNEPFSRAFSSSLVIAVGAVGSLASFTSGLSSPCVYPSAGQYTYGLQGPASGSQRLTYRVPGLRSLSSRSATQG